MHFYLFCISFFAKLYFILLANLHVLLLIIHFVLELDLPEATNSSEDREEFNYSENLHRREPTFGGVGEKEQRMGMLESF